MSFKGVVALIGLALIAIGCEQQFGTSVALIVVGALLLAAAVVDAVTEKNDERGMMNDE